MSPAYYDTGVLLKLYTTEPESPAVQELVTSRGRAITVTDLHVTEAMSALKLKAFRGECEQVDSDRAISAIEEDIHSRVLRSRALDWPAVWAKCQVLVRTQSGRLGTRALDALHVASALVLHATELITTDTRQAELAKACGLTVTHPG